MAASPKDIPRPSNDAVVPFKSEAERRREQDRIIALLAGRVAELERRLDHLTTGCPIASRLERDR